jgi:AcrR family transcriptional regulator
MTSVGGEGVNARERVASEQRERILRAVVEVLAEHGFAGATVGLVVTRARVSTRTFYELFDGLEECLVAVMEGTLEQVVALASRELHGGECWQDEVRSALAAELSFFDAEPELARVCIVETLAGGPVVLAHRERIIAAFRAPVAERIEREVPQVSPLTAEGVMGSVLGIMHAHVVERRPGPFIGLLGPLMGMVTAPYMGMRGVEAEIERGDELARAILAAGSRRSEPAPAAGGEPMGQDADAERTAERGVAIPATLTNPGARRARECLLFLAEQDRRGGADSGPSNREIAIGIGIAHQSQISKLLAYLCREDLAVKHSEGMGKRNAWRLTPHGEEIARALRATGWTVDTRNL